MKTLVLILLDESGSMGSQQNNVIRGFNTFIQEQKQLKEDEAFVTFIKFNTKISVVYKSHPVAHVPELVFSPDGGTALFDAIWEGVQVVEETEVEFDRVICVIMTDGEDNSSRKITNFGVGDLIKKKEKQGKWTFLYIGENPTRWANQTGMSGHQVAAFNHVAQHQNFSMAQTAIAQIRNQPQAQMPFSSSAFVHPSPPSSQPPPPYKP